MPVDADILSTSEWFVGEDKAITITVRNAADQPVDISGWDIEWVLRKSRYHPTIVLTKATPTGITILAQSGLTLGQFTVDIHRADTLNLRAGTYYHGAARTNSGVWDMLAEGKAVLRKAAAH